MRPVRLDYNVGVGFTAKPPPLLGPLPSGPVGTMSQALRMPKRSRDHGELAMPTGKATRTLPPSSLAPNITKQTSVPPLALNTHSQRTNPLRGFGSGNADQRTAGPQKNKSESARRSPPGSLEFWAPDIRPQARPRSWVFTSPEMQKKCSVQLLIFVTHAFVNVADLCRGFAVTPQYLQNANPIPVEPSNNSWL